MRADMPKVLVERPRLGTRSRFRERRWAFEKKTRAYRSDDALPFTMAMGFGRSRALNENLGPLRRFLRKRVGQAWDRVYSELRRDLAPRSAVDMHILQHLWDFVRFAHRDRSGRVFLLNSYGNPDYELLRDGRLSGRWISWRGMFYVCCDSGRLMFVPKERMKRPRRGARI